MLMSGLDVGEIGHISKYREISLDTELCSPKSKTCHTRNVSIVENKNEHIYIKQIS